MLMDMVSPAFSTRCRLRAFRCDVHNLELNRLEAAERSAGRSRDDVYSIAFVKHPRQVRPPKGHRVEHVAPPAEDELSMATARRSHPDDAEPRNGDRGDRIAHPGGIEEGNLADKAVVHRIGR